MQLVKCPSCGCSNFYREVTEELEVFRESGGFLDFKTLDSFPDTVYSCTECHEQFTYPELLNPTEKAEVVQ